MIKGAKVTSLDAAHLSNIEQPKAYTDAVLNFLHALRSATMDEAERLKRGAEARRRVLGDEWVDRSAKNRNAFNAEWFDLITRSPWGEVWTRPHFDDRTRRVLVIGTMIALGRWDEFKLARPRRADHRRLHRRRHQGDHFPAVGLLRRAGRQPRLQGGREVLKELGKMPSDRLNHFAPPRLNCLGSQRWDGRHAGRRSQGNARCEARRATSSRARMREHFYDPAFRAARRRHRAHRRRRLGRL